MVVGSEGVWMALKKYKFQDSQPGTLDPDYKNHVNELVENVTTALANIGKWEAIRELATETLAEGMVALNLNQVETENLKVSISNDGTKVEVQLKGDEEVYH
tara:strand:+ start:570 stop:875 length:306 start_codon:yes stop_codon:yes gene_type:complete